MDPKTIALIAASLAEITRLGFRLADLIQRGNDGSLTEEQVLAEWRAATADYDTARQGWDQAGVTDA